jgi:hypothetical protein
MIIWGRRFAFEACQHSEIKVETVLLVLSISIFDQPPKEAEVYMGRFMFTFEIIIQRSSSYSW